MAAALLPSLCGSREGAMAARLVRPLLRHRAAVAVRCPGQLWRRRQHVVLEQGQTQLRGVLGVDSCGAQTDRELPPCAAQRRSCAALWSGAGAARSWSCAALAVEGAAATVEEKEVKEQRNVVEEGEAKEAVEGTSSAGQPAAGAPSFQEAIQRLQVSDMNGKYLDTSAESFTLTMALGGSLVVGARRTYTLIISDAGSQCT